MGKIKNLTLKGCFIPLLFIISERSISLDPGLVDIFNFVESNGCSEFYYDRFDEVEMTVAGSYSSACLKRYVEHVYAELRRNEWLKLIFYLSSKREYESVLWLYGREFSSFYDERQTIRNELCFMNSEEIDYSTSLYELCSADKFFER